MVSLKNVLLFLLMGLSILYAYADNNHYKDVEKYRVFYSAFNSSFILPEIAKIYDISRGKDKGLVTIGVTQTDKIGGEAAVVTGIVSNMLAQQQKLRFVQIKERDAIYYIAPFEYYNEDFLTFKIDIQTEKERQDVAISFQKKFYYEK